jgi:hypothetical protein
VQALADLINAIEFDQALALGSLRQGVLDAVAVTTKAQVSPPPARTSIDVVARSRDFLTFRNEARGYALLDFDTKNMSAVVKERLAAAGGFVAALESVAPVLKGAARVMRASTSTGLYRTKDGHRFVDSGGIHLYVAVKDAGDIPRFVKSLHERCWLAGLGNIAVSKAGSALNRSIVDAAVATPEHLCFEGAPPLGAGLAQDLDARRPQAHEGEWLDTWASCPTLSVVEFAKLGELQAKAKREVADECARVRAVWLAERTSEIAKRCGISETAARKIAEKHAKGILLPDIELEFCRFGKVTVADVLADPQRFVNEPLADPLEGTRNDRQAAMVLRRREGRFLSTRSFTAGRLSSCDSTPRRSAESCSAPCRLKQPRPQLRTSSAPISTRSNSML